MWPGRRWACTATWTSSPSPARTRWAASSCATPPSPTSRRSCSSWAASAPDRHGRQRGPSRPGRRGPRGGGVRQHGPELHRGSRILVDAALFEDFVDELVTATERFVVGDPLDPATTIGALVEEAALERVVRYVDRRWPTAPACAQAGHGCARTPACSTRPPSSPMCGRTWRSHARRSSPGRGGAARRRSEDAIRLANDTPTASPRRSGPATSTTPSPPRAVRAGTVAINGYSEGDITTPFGGYKESGFGGRDNGLEAFAQYTETKTIWITLR